MKIVKILCIVLVLQPTASCAWKLAIFNNTTYKAYVEVNYVLCSKDYNIIIEPKKTALVDAKDCLVNMIGGVLIGKGPKVYLPAWNVPGGHRDFAITIAKQPNGKYDFNAYYGDQRINFGEPALNKALSKENIEKAGKEIETAFASFGKTLEKQVADPIVAAGDEILARFKDCSEVVALGSEWAAKKSAYETALGVLAVTQQVNDADPLQYGVYLTKEAALLGLDAGKLGAEGLAHMIEGMGVIIGGGFNITEVAFDVQVADLVQGKLPLLQIKGVFFGKQRVVSLQFDVNNPEKSMETLVKELIKMVPGV